MCKLPTPTPAVSPLPAHHPPQPQSCTGNTVTPSAHARLLLRVLAIEHNDHASRVLLNGGPARVKPTVTRHVPQLHGGSGTAGKLQDAGQILQFAYPAHAAGVEPLVTPEKGWKERGRKRAVSGLGLPPSQPGRRQGR
jgi:hypothetical protein